MRLAEDALLELQGLLEGGFGLAVAALSEIDEPQVACRDHRLEVLFPEHSTHHLQDAVKERLGFDILPLI